MGPEAPPFISRSAPRSHACEDARCASFYHSKKNTCVGQKARNFSFEPTGQENLPFIDDHRFVYVVTENYREDWVTGTHGGTDFWAIADTVVAKKRRGEISKFVSFVRVPDTRYWIESGNENALK
jgi:hypothetical protein